MVNNNYISGFIGCVSAILTDKILTVFYMQQMALINPGFICFSGILELLRLGIHTMNAHGRSRTDLLS